MTTRPMTTMEQFVQWGFNICIDGKSKIPEKNFYLLREKDFEVFCNEFERFRILIEKTLAEHPHDFTSIFDQHPLIGIFPEILLVDSAIFLHNINIGPGTAGWVSSQTYKKECNQ